MTGQTDPTPSAADERHPSGPQVPIGRIMARHVACIDPHATLREVSDKLAAVEVGALVVGTREDVLGVISERDVVQAIAVGRDPDVTQASEVASTGPAVYCSSDDTAIAVAEVMDSASLRHVLVRDGNRLSGIVSARDLIGAFAR